MSTEERILDYLDGSLGEHDSAELMHQLSVSPEKRVILEQHIKLSELTRVAQRPFDVPADLEETLAKRLPAVIGMSSSTGVVGRSATSSLLLLLRQYPIRFAMGGLLTLLAGGAIYWYGMTGSSTIEVAERSADHRSTSEHSAAVSNLTTPTGTTNNTGSSSATNAGTTGSDIANDVNGHQSADRSTSASLSSSHNTIVGSHASQTARNTAGVEHRDRIARRSGSVGSANGGSEIAQSESANNVARNASVSTDASDILAKENMLGDVPVGSVRAQSTQNIVGSESSSHRSLRDLVSHPDSRRSDWAVRASLGFGSTYLYVPSGGNSYVTRNEVGMPMLGLDYALGAHFAVGAELGMSTNQSLSPTSSVVTDGSISRVVTHATSTTSSSAFSRAVLRYTINPYDAFRFEVSAGAGRAFGSAGGWMGSGQFGVNFQPGGVDGMELQISALYSGVLTSTSASTDVSTASATNGPVEYTTTSTPRSSIYTPAFSLRAGIQYRLP